MAERHQHQDVVHEHTHHHVVHYLSHGKEWTHLMATHDLGHNHPPVEHIHQDLRTPEHEREAHIHDHAHPSESPG
jgi:hypothetical protein